VKGEHPSKNVHRQPSGLAAQNDLMPALCKHQRLQLRRLTFFAATPRARPRSLQANRLPAEGAHKTEGPRSQAALKDDAGCTGLVFAGNLTKIL